MAALTWMAPVGNAMHMGALDATGATPLGPSPDRGNAVDPVRHAAVLLRHGEVAAARQVVQEALSATRRSSDLLWVLADIEFKDGDLQAGMTRLTEAAEVCGQNATALSRKVKALSSNRLWREAIISIEHIPADLRDQPPVREACGDFYRARQCHAHSVDSYGNAAGLSSAARTRRFWSWLYSGGPFSFLRLRIFAWEESTLLTVLHRGRQTAEQLTEIPELSEREVFRLKALIDSVIYEWWQIIEVWNAILRQLIWMAPAGFLLVWLVIYLTVKESDFMSGPGGVVGGSFVTAIVATGGAVLVMRLLVRKDLSPRIGVNLTMQAFFSLLIATIIAEFAVGAGYDSHVLPTMGWWGWIVFGLVTLPAVFATMMVIAVAINVRVWRKLSKLFRNHCQIVLLDTLLAILHGVRFSTRRRDVDWRRGWAQHLEWAARSLRKDLLPASFLKEISAGEWLKRRTAGWAEALHHMQREIVAPVPGNERKLESALRHQIRCLATGELGALAWRQPPALPSRRTTFWRRASVVTRTVLVAGLPLAAVLAGQSLLHLSAGALRWAGILTGAWALLYIIISLDPAIHDKIETARSLVTTLHDVHGIGPRDLRG
jgi:hypothetical protein